MRSILMAAAALLVTVLAAFIVLRTPPHGAASPSVARTVSLAPDAVPAIDALVGDAMRDRIIPGAALAVVRSDGTFLIRKAYGARTFEPRRVSNDLTTIYELASMTKPIATASAVMLLVQHGRLRLPDRVARYIPEFAAAGKGEVDIAQLLTHTSGMQPDYPPSDYTADRAQILAHAYASKLRFAPGTKFEYSDLGYIVLSEVVARIAREPFERFVRDGLFIPLGMRDSSFDTTFDPRAASRVAPQTRAQTDAKLRRLFGTVPAVNGHAGMLATLDDVARFAVAELRALRGDPLPDAPLAPATVRAMIRPRYVGDGAVRGLGWDLDSAFSNNRGDLLARGGFGHTGSSGTSIWIDPAFDVAIVFLSNAHYPDDVGTTLPLEGKIADIVAGSLAGVDPGAVRAQETAFDAAAARSALGFPAHPGPPPRAVQYRQCTGPNGRQCISPRSTGR